MKMIRNRFLPPKGFEAINMFGLLFFRREATLTEELVRHERIHTAQMIELLFIGFYLWYVAEWLIRLACSGNAYRNISFEREAYKHMDEPGYLSRRKHYAWLKYLKKMR